MKQEGAQRTNGSNCTQVVERHERTDRRTGAELELPFHEPQETTLNMIYVIRLCMQEF